MREKRRERKRKEEKVVSLVMEERERGKKYHMQLIKYSLIPLRMSLREKVRERESERESERVRERK